MSSVDETNQVASEVEVSLSKYVVDLENCGHVDVYVDGDLETGKNGESVFLTIHGIGNSYKTWANFMNHEDMLETKNRSVMIHVCLPGQGEEDADLEAEFPGLSQLGMNLVSVLDHLRVNRVVVLGEGAGANIAARFAANHPTRVAGIMLLNCKHAVASFPLKLKVLRNSKYNSESKLNMKNVAKYEQAYKERDEILSLMETKINVDTLIMCGGNNEAVVRATEEMHAALPIGLCSIIKVDGVKEIMLEAADKVADSLILFCQGLGLVPSVQRKISRSISITGDTDPDTGKMVPKDRKVSMEMFDIPNIRRLSLSTHHI